MAASLIGGKYFGDVSVDSQIVDVRSKFHHIKKNFLCQLNHLGTPTPPTIRVNILLRLHYRLTSFEFTNSI